VTLATTAARNNYIGTGTTGPFAFSYRINAATDLLVTKRSVAGFETTLVNGVDYTVTGVGTASGSITLTTALASGEALAIRRAPPLTQDVAITNQGPGFSRTIENEFDRLTMQLQSLKDLLDRSVKLSRSPPP